MDQLSDAKIDIETLKKFSKFIFQVRQFFHIKGFFEASTPTLVECPGTEPFLDPFMTEFHFGKKTKKFYLPTSPEISLKKLICQGSGPIFEIKNVFRNNEIGHHHSPEFLMLEWYRTEVGINQIQKDVEELIRYLLIEKSQDQSSSFSVQRKTMRQLFAEYLQFQLKPTTSQAEFYMLAVKNNLSVKKDESIEDLFSLIFLELIESKFDMKEPLFVTDYPPFQAAYARINKEGWAERFEFYWQGLEIANAFYEVTDANEQLLRMNKDNEFKKKIGKDPVRLDQEFIDLMSNGMPECSGIALGIERLFMALYKIDNIKRIRPFYL